MHQKLETAISIIEKQRAELMEMIAQLSMEDINRSPRHNKWSISQIISHLIVAERLSINYLKKKIQGVDQAGDSGIAEELKMVILKISQRMPGIRFKAPRQVIENTPYYTDISTLQSEWNSTRNELREFLETIQEHHLKRKIYKHVVVGYLNVLQAVQFFGEHVTHHTPQIKRLIKLRIN